MSNIIEIYDKELEKQAMQITEIFLDVANKQNKTLEEVVEIYYNVIKSKKNKISELELKMKKKGRECNNCAYYVNGANDEACDGCFEDVYKHPNFKPKTESEE